MFSSWPDGVIERSLIEFIRLAEASGKGSSIRRPLDILMPEKVDRSYLPPAAWWDRADKMLTAIAEQSFQPVWGDKNWAKGRPRPIAAALARYEPVLGKISHHYSPTWKVWDANLMTTGKSIRQHFLTLQEDAVGNGHFSRIPDPEPPKYRDGGAGLIPLLESLAIYPEKAGNWAEPGNGLMVLDDVLVVSQLQECPYVSCEGRAWYKEGPGCILVPFVAHDRRLVGHGIVLFDKTLELRSDSFLQDMVNGWRVLFAGTFLPLIANLNCATLSVLDGFFLGRVRELRYMMHSINGRHGAPSLGPSIPRKDILVLNKVSIYELLQEEIAKRRVWIVFFDLDGFKTINRDLGHQKADELLFSIAEHLVAKVFSPTEDRWLGRFGGDEFIGIANYGDDIPKQLSESIAAVITEVQVAYNASAASETKPIHLSTSMGWVDSGRIDRNAIQISGLSEDRKRVLLDMRDAERMIEIADTDTQEYVKRLGKNGYLLWDERSMCRCTDEQPWRDLDRLLEAVKKLPQDGRRSVKLEFLY